LKTSEFRLFNESNHWNLIKLVDLLSSAIKIGHDWFKYWSVSG